VNLLQNWVDTPIAGALGWTLLHTLWEGALLSLALAAVLLATRSARIRYVTACAALFGLFAAFCITLMLVFPEQRQGLHAAKTTAIPAWRVPSGAASADGPQAVLDVIAPWLAPFWILGVYAFQVGYIVSWISALRMRRRGVCAVPAHWQRQIERLSAQLGVKRPVQLLESCLVDSPVLLGHLKPVILLPLELLAGMPSGQLEAILMHELAHVRRHDYLVNTLQRLVEGMLFYHPATWWISHVIRRERENCCDDLVVAFKGDAEEYAVALAALEQDRWSGRTPAVAATGGNLVKRIGRLLYPKRTNGAWAQLFSAVLLMAGAAAILTAWQASPSAQQASADPYAKWLNEDVVYIIADEERGVFQRLQADDERAKFIEQFWLRRDPSPGALPNEFKEEHYRRIAYANQRFRTAYGRSGWQTDRGHLYIVYGPPDEIESHPSGNSRTYPTETWLYRHVQGVGDNLTIAFIDRTGTGDYRLVPGKSR
jgi:GWxTD domain-containing protein